MNAGLVAHSDRSTLVTLSLEGLWDAPESATASFQQPAEAPSHSYWTWKSYRVYRSTGRDSLALLLYSPYSLI